MAKKKLHSKLIFPFKAPVFGGFSNGHVWWNGRIIIHQEFGLIQWKITWFDHLIWEDHPSVFGDINGYHPFRSTDIPKFSWLPSGKRLHNYGKIHHFYWENSLFLWPCSIAFCMFTKGYNLNDELIDDRSLGPWGPGTGVDVLPPDRSCSRPLNPAPGSQESMAQSRWFYHDLPYDLPADRSDFSADFFRFLLIHFMAGMVSSLVHHSSP